MIKYLEHHSKQNKKHKHFVITSHMVKKRGKKSNYHVIKKMLSTPLSRLHRETWFHSFYKKILSIDHNTRSYSLRYSDFILPKRFSFCMRTTSKINSLSKSFLFFFFFPIDESKDNFIIYSVVFLGHVFLFSSSYQISTLEANTEFICENTRT